MARMTLPSRADDVADLVGIDHDDFETRSIRGQRSSGHFDPLAHLAEYVNASDTGLFEGDLHDLLADAGDLHVHLEGGDAVGIAGDLEVHVAQVVFIAQDVGENDELVAFLDETHGNDRRPGPVKGTPASMRAMRDDPHTVAMELDPLDSSTSDTTRMVYGNSPSGGRAIFTATLRQSSVSNFTSTGPAKGPCFPRRKRAGSCSAA